MPNDRRRFLTTAATLGIGAVAAAPGQLRSDDGDADRENDHPEEVSAVEDLMRETGSSTACY